MPWRRSDCLVAIRLCACLSLLVGAFWSVASLAQGGPFPGPPSRPELPRPEWAAPNPGPSVAGLPGAGMPGADPFQLLENSKQVQVELGLTPHQLENIHLAAIHNQGRLEELSHRLGGESPEQMRAEIDDQRRTTQANDRAGINAETAQSLATDHVAARGSLHGDFGPGNCQTPEHPT